MGPVASERHADEVGREEYGPIHGYGCADCEVWWPKGSDTHPLTEANDHARRRHDGDREPIVIVRDETAVATWEVAE